MKSWQQSHSTLAPVVAIFLLVAGAARAEQIRVMTSGAFSAAYLASPAASPVITHSGLETITAQ